MTKEDKVRWDSVEHNSQQARFYIEEMRSLLIVEPDHPERKEMEDEIKCTEKVLEMMKKMRD